MKKIILSVLILFIASNMVFASTQRYDDEMQKIKTVKNAQMDVINERIKDVVSEMETLNMDTTIAPMEKKQKMYEYQNQLDKLTTRKIQIEKQYKSDKERLKFLYK